MPADSRRHSTGSARRMELLEAQVRLLSAALDLRPDALTAVVPDEVLDLARAGKQVGAIRLLRKRTGLGLVAAKRVVEAATSPGLAIQQA